MIDEIIENYPDLFYSTGNPEDGSQQMFFKDKSVSASPLKITEFNTGTRGFNIYSEQFFRDATCPDAVSLIIFDFKSGSAQFFDYKPLDDEILIRFYNHGIVFDYFENKNVVNSPVITYDIVSVLRRASIKDIIQ